MEKDMLICGDFMPGGVLYRQNSFVDEEVIRFIKEHQFVVATLECALTDNDDYLAVPSEKAVPKVVVKKEDLDFSSKYEITFTTDNQDFSKCWVILSSYVNI